MGRQIVPTHKYNRYKMLTIRSLFKKKNDRQDPFQITRLEETDSTNTYIRQVASKQQQGDQPQDTPSARYQVVTAAYQSAGRGQGSNSWESERGKNLLFSILCHPVWIPITGQFILSEAFNKAIIDATAPYCVAYKPNLAFYECFGVKGWMAFEKTVEYIKTNYPDQFIIADAKRGDIGNTSAMYARCFFEEGKVDSLTVAPYMGEDSVTPFLTYEGKWVILLALTSNKGSHVG